MTHPTVQAHLTGQPRSKTIGRRLHARTGIRVAVAVFTAALIALAVPSFASAQQFPGVFQVTTRAEGNDGECTRDCTLREAVNLAGQPGQTSSITVPPGVYRLTGGPLVLRNVSLFGAGLSGGFGAGARSTIIDARGNSRVFEVPAGSSSLAGGVTVTGGGSATTGGGVLVDAGGTLFLHNATSQGNAAAARGGGIHEPRRGLRARTRRSPATASPTASAAASRATAAEPRRSSGLDGHRQQRDGRRRRHLRRRQS